MSNTTVESETTRNRSLDILKFIASYMVVFIHFKFYGRVGIVIDAIARFAVPVFFMTSGYFSYMNTTDKLKKKIIHIIKIYLCGFVLYFCFHAILNFYNEGIAGVISYFSRYCNIITIILFFVFNCPKSSGHLWFLSALIYVYVIQYFVTKWRIKETIYLRLAVCLLGIHLILGVGFSAFGIVTPVYLIRNFLLMGYPLFCLGLLLRKNEAIILKKISYRSTTVILFFGIFETIISRLICGRNELYFGSILIAVALFIMALKMHNKSYSLTLKKLSATSTTIYLIHNIIGKSILNVFSSNTILWKFTLPVVVCIFSTVVALITNMISRKFKSTKR